MCYALCRVNTADAHQIPLTSPSDTVDVAANASEAVSPDTEALISLIRNSIIGANDCVVTPFGETRITYADYTASVTFPPSLLEHELCCTISVVSCIWNCFVWIC